MLENNLQELVAGQEERTQAEIAQVIHDRFSHLLALTESRIFVEMGQAVEAAGFKSRRAASEHLNQIMRRLRLCKSTDEVADWLMDSASSFTSQAALFEVTSTSLRGVQARGFPISFENFAEVEVPLHEAPAFAQSARDADTVVAVGSASEVSAQVVTALGHAVGEKVYLYPVVIEGKTVAILYATAGSGPEHQFVDGAALELLTQAAASAAQIVSSRPDVGAAMQAAQIGAGLVSIEGVQTGTAPVGGKAALLCRAAEARARSYARAAVAAIRLRQNSAVERGRAERNIYRVLRPQIDDARRVYKQDYLAVSPATADYLHSELVKLVHDDESLLGPEYPGRLV